MKYQIVLRNSLLFMKIETIGSKSSQLHRYVPTGDFKITDNNSDMQIIDTHQLSSDRLLGFWSFFFVFPPMQIYSMVWVVTAK